MIEASILVINVTNNLHVTREDHLKHACDQCEYKANELGNLKTHIQIIH